MLTLLVVAQPKRWVGPRQSAYPTLPGKLAPQLAVQPFWKNLKGKKLMKDFMFRKMM